MHGNLPMVTTNLEIYQAATLLVKSHSKDAPIHAAMRADELLKAGDLDGKAVWVRIMKAIGELLSEKQTDGANIH